MGHKAIISFPTVRDSQVIVEIAREDGNAKIAKAFVYYNGLAKPEF
jgi:hypothetical protein